jgi:hypothetical protein
MSAALGVSAPLPPEVVDDPDEDDELLLLLPHPAAANTATRSATSAVLVSLKSPSS